MNSVVQLVTHTTKAEDNQQHSADESEVQKKVDSILEIQPLEEAEPDWSLESMHQDIELVDGARYGEFVDDLADGGDDDE